MEVWRRKDRGLSIGNVYKGNVIRYGERRSELRSGMRK